jgi:hypothetical protein
MLLTEDTIGAQQPEDDAQTTVKTLATQHVEQGFSVQFAEILGVALDEFPCLVLFEDVRSSRHMTIALRGMDAAEIAEKLKAVFSTINAAVAKGDKPLTALEAQRDREIFIKAGNSIISMVKSAAKETLETAIGAAMKTVLASVGLA